MLKSHDGVVLEDEGGGVAAGEHVVERREQFDHLRDVRRAQRMHVQRLVPAEVDVLPSRGGEEACSIVAVDVLAVVSGDETEV